MNRMKSSFVKLLQSKKLYIIVPIVAFILASPSIGAGLMMDDYYHRLVFLGESELQKEVSFNGKSLTPFDAFVFMEGGEEETRHTKAEGLMPWWSSNNLKLAFFRPITSLSYLLDYTLWPNNIPLMHIHSILLFCLLAMMIIYLYRALELPGWSAGLAALLMMLSGAWSMPVGWLANRNALLALLFAIPALIFYHRYRQGGRLKFQLAALALFSLALLSAEAGLAIFAYFFSYTLFMDSSRWRSRVKAIAPYILVVIVWRLGYTLVGYGAKGGSLYIDPFHNPINFVGVLIKRYFLFISGMFGGTPTDMLFLFSSQLNTVIAIVGAVVITVLAILFRPLWHKNGKALFWAVGMFCSIVPFCLTFPAGRNLVFPFIGAMGLFATFLYSYRREGGSTQYKGVSKAMVVTYMTLFLFVSGLLSPLYFLVSHSNIKYSGLLNRNTYNIEGVDDFEGKELLFLNLPMHIMLGYGFELHLQGRSAPAKIRVLSSGSDSVEAKLIDRRTLAVKPQVGFYPPPAVINKGDKLVGMNYGERRFELLFGREGRKVSVGERFRAGALEVEVKGLTPDSRPGEVNYHFAKPLDSPDYIWVTWDYKQGRAVLVTLPEPGESFKVN